MLAVFVNVLTVLFGSSIGILSCGKIPQKYMDNLFAALALVTIVIGISSAVSTADVLCLIVSMVVGTALGTLLHLDDAITNAGDAIRRKIGGRGSRFTEGFVSASILFCVGSMTIMGSLEAGLYGNYSILYAKSALDAVSSMVFGAGFGIGVTFASLFVLVFQGLLVLLAGAIAPYLSAAVVTEMSAAGGTILIGMGLNMLELSPKKIKVADMLPAILLPILYMLIFK